MPFINIDDIEPISPVPGCRMRTPFGQNLMLSYLEMDDGAEVPLHSHPHEQGGMLIRGRVALPRLGESERLAAPRRAVVSDQVHGHSAARRILPHLRDAL